MYHSGEKNTRDLTPGRDTEASRSLFLVGPVSTMERVMHKLHLSELWCVAARRQCAGFSKRR